MNSADIVAYIGAAAWLPQIVTWAYRSMVKPTLRIIPSSCCEIGFTCFGPIFNVPMAFLVANKDLIIDGIDVTITHADGDSHVFRWAGIQETLSEITDSFGNKQTVSKAQSPIAIKATINSIFEKVILFQEPSYHSSDALVLQACNRLFDYLKRHSPDSFVEDLLASREFFEVVEHRKNWFWWKTGRYELTLQPTSPQRFNLDGATFVFELMPADVELLRSNIENIRPSLVDLIRSNHTDAISSQPSWTWVRPVMQRN